MSQLEAALLSSSFRNIIESQRTFDLPFYSSSSFGILYNSEDVTIDEIDAAWKFSVKFPRNFHGENNLELNFEIKENKVNGSGLHQLKNKTFKVAVLEDGNNLFTSPDYYLQIPATLTHKVNLRTVENKVFLISVKVSIIDCCNIIDTNAMCKKIASKNIDMLNDPTYSDFTFIVEGKEFKVHKNILAVTSPIFLKLFTSKMRESHENKCQVIDIKSSVFEHMIRFIYGGILPPDIKNISMSLYEVAHYYDIKDLMDICKNVIRSNLSTANAHEIYAWAILYNIEDLKSDAMKLGNIVGLNDTTTNETIKNLIAQKEMDLAMLKRIYRKSIEETPKEILKRKKKC